MIPPAPVDFWMQVVARVATLVFERETAPSAGVRLQGMGPVPMMTDSERARIAALTEKARVEIGRAAE